MTRRRGLARNRRNARRAAERQQRKSIIQPGTTGKGNATASGSPGRPGREVGRG